MPKERAESERGNQGNKTTGSFSTLWWADGSTTPIKREQKKRKKKKRKVNERNLGKRTN